MRLNKKALALWNEAKDKLECTNKTNNVFAAYLIGECMERVVVEREESLFVDVLGDETNQDETYSNILADTGK